MFKEFKEFVMLGNMIDLDVGEIIGTAFGKVITSLVNDILLPPIGLLLGKVDFSNLFITLDSEKYTALAQEADSVTLDIGIFLNTFINFLIVALVFFLLIHQLNKLENKDEKLAEVTTKTSPYCQTEIPIKAIRCSIYMFDLI